MKWKWDQWPHKNFILLYNPQSCSRGISLEPDPTRPTIAFKKSGSTPTHAMKYIWFMSSEFKLPTENNIQYYYYSCCLHDFEGNSWKYSSSCIVMLPGGGKAISSSLIFQDRGLEATKKTAKYLIIIAIECTGSLVWTGLNSEDWAVALSWKFKICIENAGVW